MPPLKHSLYKWFDPKGEHPFTLKKGRNNVGCSYKTLMTCAREGRIAPSGEKIRLRVCQIPHGLATTKEEFERFISAISSFEDY
jgi:hypothetical protein